MTALFTVDELIIKVLERTVYCVKLRHYNT